MPVLCQGKRAAVSGRAWERAGARCRGCSERAGRAGQIGTHNRISAQAPAGSHAAVLPAPGVKANGRRCLQHPRVEGAGGKAGPWGHGAGVGITLAARGAQPGVGTSAWAKGGAGVSGVEGGTGSEPWLCRRLRLESISGREKQMGSRGTRQPEHQRAGQTDPRAGWDQKTQVSRQRQRGRWHLPPPQ